MVIELVGSATDVDLLLVSPWRTSLEEDDLPTLVSVGVDDERGAKRGKHGRLESAYSPDLLLPVIAEIAQYADPFDPYSVGHALFNECRAPAGHPRCPLAKTIVEMPDFKGWGWEAILRHALDGDVSPQKFAGWRIRDTAERPIDKPLARTWLKRVVALRDQRTVTPDEFDETCRQLEHEGRRHRRSPGRLRPPTSGQIRRVYGSWKAALKDSGLEVSDRQGGPRVRGVPIVEAIEFCLEAHGALPTEKDVRLRFAEANNFALAARQPDQTTETIYAELRARRARVGKWTPPEYAPRHVRGLFSIPTGREYGPPRKPWKTRRECVDSLKRFRRWLPSGVNATQARYLEFVRKHEGEAPLSSVIRAGGMAALLAVADREQLADHQ